MVAIVCTALGAALGLPARAGATTIDLGLAGQYTVFGLGSEIAIGSTTDLEVNTGQIYGNVAVGADTTSPNASGIAFFQKGFATGNVDVDTRATYTIVNKNFSIGGALTGTVAPNPGDNPDSVGQGTANLVPAVQAAMNAASVYAAMAGTPTTISLNSASLTLNAGIWSTTNFYMNSEALLTINGGASDIFVLNVSGSFDLTKSFIVLTGGITADQVLFNVTGSGDDVKVGGDNSIFFGTLLAVSRSIIVQGIGSQGGCTEITCQGVSLGPDGIAGTEDDNPGWDGRVIGALGTETLGDRSIDFKSGAEINGPTRVPEPSALFLLATGLAGLAAARWRGRHST